MQTPVILNRRSFLRQSTLGLGALALGRLLGGAAQGEVLRTAGADFKPRASKPDAAADNGILAASISAGTSDSFAARRPFRRGCRDWC